MRVAVRLLLIPVVVSAAACGGGGGTTAPSSTGGTNTGGGTSAPVATNSVEATTSSTFSPPSIVVAVGSTVTFNFASVVHNVNFSGTGAPISIPNTSNSAVTRAFAVAGVFDYNCSIHSGMTGKVTVQ